MVDTDRTSVHSRRAHLLGFIVNPVAGMGGTVGLKGTDGEAIAYEHIRRGARPTAAERAAKAIVRLTASLPHVNVLTVAGPPMGEEAGERPNFERWMIGHSVELAQAGIDPDSLRRDAGAHGASPRCAGQSMLRAWLRDLPA